MKGSLSAVPQVKQALSVLLLSLVSRTVALALMDMLASVLKVVVLVPNPTWAGLEEQALNKHNQSMVAIDATATEHPSLVPLSHPALPLILLVKVLSQFLRSRLTNNDRLVLTLLVSPLGLMVV